MSSGEPLVLRGHAALTGVWYPVGSFEEMLRPGCFGRTLGESPDVVLNLMHGRGGTGLPLARTTAGTLTLTEDQRGLFLEARLDPDDPDSQLLVRKLARGDLNGEASFAFNAANQRWSEDYTRRTILTATLHKGDVSVVDFGANENTSVGIDADVIPRAMVRRPVTLAPLPDHTTAAKARLAALRWANRKAEN